MATLHAFTPSLLPNLCVCGRPKGDPAHGFEPKAVEPKAVARRGDPETSWEAADSVGHIRRSQMEVLALFQTYGQMTDEQARDRYVGNQSLSGFRTRRSELVNQGLLKDSGLRHRGSTGRKMVIWKVVG